MASAISYHDQFFNVSNSRFRTLIEFALEVGDTSAETDQEKGYVTVLRDKTNNFYPGYDLAIETEFPSRDERKFWARVFFDLAHLIFQRKIGKQDTSFWQYSAVGDAYLFARMITRSVQEEEQGWHPKTIASLEAEAFYNQRLKVRL